MKKSIFVALSIILVLGMIMTGIHPGVGKFTVHAESESLLKRYWEVTICTDDPNLVFIPDQDPHLLTDLTWQPWNQVSPGDYPGEEYATGGLGARSENVLEYEFSGNDRYSSFMFEETPLEGVGKSSVRLFLEFEQTVHLKFYNIAGDEAPYTASNLSNNKWIDLELPVDLFRNTEGYAEGFALSVYTPDANAGDGEGEVEGSLYFDSIFIQKDYFIIDRSYYYLDDGDPEYDIDLPWAGAEAFTEKEENIPGPNTDDGIGPHFEKVLDYHFSTQETYTTLFLDYIPVQKAKKLTIRVYLDADRPMHVAFYNLDIPRYYSSKKSPQYLAGNLGTKRWMDIDLPVERFIDDQYALSNISISVFEADGSPPKSAGHLYVDSIRMERDEDILTAGEFNKIKFNPGYVSDLEEDEWLPLSRKGGHTWESGHIWKDPGPRSNRDELFYADFEHGAERFTAITFDQKSLEGIEKVRIRVRVEYSNHAAAIALRLKIYNINEITTKDEGVTHYAVYTNRWYDLSLPLENLLDENGCLIGVGLMLNSESGGPINIGARIYVDSISFEREKEDIEPVVSLKKTGNKFRVNIEEWNEDHKYQIWTYQSLESDAFDGNAGENNQWVLESPYMAGRDFDLDTETGFLYKDLDEFGAVDDKYTIAVKVLDEHGDIIGTYKASYSPDDISEVRIKKVYINGERATDAGYGFEVDWYADINLEIIGNMENLTYKAIVRALDLVLDPVPGHANAFSWTVGKGQIGDRETGLYQVELYAFAEDDDENYDKTVLDIHLYHFAPLSRAQIDFLHVTSQESVDEEDPFSLFFKGEGMEGHAFSYTIGEAWRNPVFSEFFDFLPYETIEDNSIPHDEYGYFNVGGFVHWENSEKADDGMMKTIHRKRPDVEVSMHTEIDGASDFIVNKGEMVTLTSESSGIPDAVYSFWRRDANGWTLIRDYSSKKSLTWRPNRVGIYSIQVRAKQAGAITYECLENLEFEVIDPTYGDEMANIIQLSIEYPTRKEYYSGHALPLTAIAHADNGDDLLYKFIITNDYLHYVETSYSPNPNYLWIAGKASVYKISVLVKSADSFGKYDAISQVTVYVENQGA